MKKKEECRTKSQQASLKGMPLFLLHFCFYSLLSQPHLATQADLCVCTLAQSRCRRTQEHKLLLVNSSFVGTKLKESPITNFSSFMDTIFLPLGCLCFFSYTVTPSHFFMTDSFTREMSVAHLYRSSVLHHNKLFMIRELLPSLTPDGCSYRNIWKALHKRTGAVIESTSCLLMSIPIPVKPINK